MAQISIDLESFTKEQLIGLILYAHGQDITFNEAMIRALTSYLDKNKH